MNRSESITNIAAALVEAQKNIGAAEKGTVNPFFKSRYSDLGTVMAVCKEPLLAQGISVLQLVQCDPATGHTVLETTLLHASGEYISSVMLVSPSKANDPQSMGSAIAYARRYALQSALFIPSVDDDAEWASRAASNRPDVRAITADFTGKSQEELQAMVEQFQAQAAEAESPEVRRTLLGLASEARCAVEDAKLGGKPTNGKSAPGWDGYVLRHASKSYNGMRLDQLTTDQIIALHEKRGIPNAEHADPAIREEAAMINLAYRYVAQAAGVEG